MMAAKCDCNIYEFCVVCKDERESKQKLIEGINQRYMDSFDLPVYDGRTSEQKKEDRAYAAKRQREVEHDLNTQCEIGYKICEEREARKHEEIDHPSHYGGDTTYEAIKVIEAWGLGFNLGNTLKYISRADKKGNRLENLKKALWYLNREIENAQKHK